MASSSGSGYDELTEEEFVMLRDLMARIVNLKNKEGETRSQKIDRINNDFLSQSSDMNTEMLYDEWHKGVYDPMKHVQLIEPKIMEDPSKLEKSIMAACLDTVNVKILTKVVLKSIIRELKRAHAQACEEAEAAQKKGNQIKRTLNGALAQMMNMVQEQSAEKIT